MMKIKKTLLLLVVSLFAVALLVGCTDDEDTTGTVDEGSDLEGSITIAGSTSVQPISEVLASVFMEEHRDVRISVAGGGSGAGVVAAQENTADFGAVSREVRDDETGIETHVIAIDGIAIIVHPDNGVEDISLADVQSIFAGEITNWSDVGGADESIVVVSREEGSGTRGAFDDIVLDDEALVDTALIQNSTGAVSESVSVEEFAIGYVSTGSLNDDVKAVQVDGVEPASEDIVSGAYPVARPFNYVVNEDEELPEIAQAFLDFILSNEGQDVVEEQGYVKVN